VVREEHGLRHQAAMAGMIDAYGEINKLLSRLPLPIQVPSLRGELYRGEVRTALVHAFAVVGDLPMDARARQSLREVIGDWLIAVEFMFCDEEDEAAWHLDVTQTQLLRILNTIELVENLLAASTGHG
jgi:hypothetical protein